MRAIFEKNIDFQGGEYGNAILSRLPIDAHENHYLPRSPGGEQRGALEARVRVDGEELVFIATHFDHRSNEDERLASVAALRELVEKHRDLPVIVAGDLNATPDSETMSDAAALLTDVCAAAGPRSFTFPADEPRRRIDYVLSNSYPGLRCTGCRVIPEAIASDHRPVLAIFELEADDL
jgi:endonuclease/exonuclease/phosphatase family metal-dependent hydrolase